MGVLQYSICSALHFCYFLAEQQICDSISEVGCWIHGLSGQVPQKGRRQTGRDSERVKNRLLKVPKEKLLNEYELI